MFDNKGFYPTPSNLIRKMLEGIDFDKIKTVLEPSAGKGNIVDMVSEKFKYSRNRYRSWGNEKTNWDIDTVEIDSNLQHILKGKGYRVVHNDFLNLHTYKNYDLIVMNPPFHDGDLHLLKAIELQKNGGKIVCLLNAETLNNAYSNARQDLLTKLEDYNADIEFIKDAFSDAERTTNVEIALIKIDIPKKQNDSTILTGLKREEQFRAEASNSYGNLINADFINGIVEQYNFEVKLGLKLIAEYNTLKSYMLSGFKENSNPVLQLVLNGKEDEATLENAYIKQIRMKYWTTLFTSEAFMGVFTSNLRQKYYNKVQELRDYDFSAYNIYTIKIELNKEMVKGVEETILNLFDEFSHKHHWYDEMSKNIHLYNGWKSNAAHKINKKIVMVLSGYKDLQYSWGGFRPSRHSVIDKLTDIEKTFAYLDGGKVDHVDLKAALTKAEADLQTKKIVTKYFSIDFYKKGTAHLTFLNDELLLKLNVFGSQRKGWLPPVYGKAKYQDMTTEEKEVINEFQGKESYNKVMNEKDYYIQETSGLLMLGA